MHAAVQTGRSLGLANQRARLFRRVPRFQRVRSANRAVPFVHDQLADLADDLFINRSRETGNADVIERAALRALELIYTSVVPSLSHASSMRVRFYVARHNWRHSNRALPAGTVFFRDFTNYSAGIARGEHAFGNVPGYNASRSDHCSRANTDARQNDRAAADPYVRSDFDGLAELFFSSLHRIPGMHWR
jgi:hypothetical protein